MYSQSVRRMRTENVVLVMYKADTLFNGADHVNNLNCYYYKNKYV